MKKNGNEIIKNINEQINQIKINFKNNINISYQELIQNKESIIIKEIENWKNSILINILTQLDKLIDYIISDKDGKINENINKKEYIIESKSELNFFTSKDVQEENKEITNYFQNEAYNYMNVIEKVENENVAIFLKDVAKISRIAYNEGKNLFKIMKDKYIEYIGKKIVIENENSKKEFSSWVKNLEKENGAKEYENILKQIHLFDKDENKKDQKILLKLFYDLTKMYFHCNISFPSIEISFKKEDNFNSDKMIDFINRGKNRKVNFIVLPSLISNGNFLQNGKYWVFTYSKNTFKFEELMIAPLNDFIKKEHSILKNIKDNLTIKVSCRKINDEKYIIINTNIELPENIEYKFIFYLINKKTNKSYKIKIKAKSFKIDKNIEIKKYEFKLENEIIISSSDIIIEK